jgi:NADP-dependent 3-hydroxy acid dehydrogenase YdfG
MSRRRMTEDMEHAVTIIVGASSGMGEAAAGLFVRSGHRVVLAARNREKLHKLAEELGEGAVAAATDVQRREQVDELIRFTASTEKRIDNLLYFAGTNVPERAVDILTTENWDTMLRTNLTGAFYCTKAVLPVMRRQGHGLILYISSCAAKSADRSGVAYQASKRGLVGLAHGTFQEERDNGIRTSVLFPGFTDTPLAMKRPVPPDPETLRLALKPEDVAAACLFVSSLPPRAYVPELDILPTGLQ